MEKYIIEVYTNWCGEENNFFAIANDETELDDIASQLAYDNFSEFDGFNTILEELNPEVEDGEYTYGMEVAAAEVEGDYYGYNIRLAEEEDWFDEDNLVYDAREKV